MLIQSDTFSIVLSHDEVMEMFMQYLHDDVTFQKAVNTCYGESGVEFTFGKNQ